VTSKSRKTPGKRAGSSRTVSSSRTSTVTASILVRSKSKADRLFEKAAKEIYSKRDKRVG